METKIPNFIETARILKIEKSKNKILNYDIMPSCNEKKIDSGKTCYASKVRHKKCGHESLASKKGSGNKLLAK